LSYASQDLYPDNTIGAFTVELARSIHLGPNTNWEVGLCEFTCPGATGKSVGLIYCDLISAQFVGSSLVRSLRTCIYPSPERQRGRFENVYYVHAEKQKIKNITIEILTLEGERVKFDDSVTPSRLVLHFRKVPLSW
jgi:hypothetical protein